MITEEWIVTAFQPGASTFDVASGKAGTGPAQLTVNRPMPGLGNSLLPGMAMTFALTDNSDNWQAGDKVELTLTKKAAT